MIEAYLRRLRMARPSTANVATLRALQAAHQREIPFENLDVYTGIPLRLELPALVDKVLGRDRGGFCYELNFLFSHLLTGLGYPVRLMSAGVFDAEGVVGPPFDHLCLRVEADGRPWLCDVGFGRAALHPLPLAATERFEDPAGVFRLRRNEARRDGFGPPVWCLDRRARDDARSAPDGWMPLYVFDDAPRAIEDFADQCRWHQQSPEAMFPRKLIFSRATHRGRVSVRDLEWIREEDGRRDTGTFADPSERREMVRSAFGIEIPE
jgi:N-hydroxyarylamine O-acetyltransferase